MSRKEEECKPLVLGGVRGVRRRDRQPGGVRSGAPRRLRRILRVPGGQRHRGGAHGGCRGHAALAVDVGAGHDGQGLTLVRVSAQLELFCPP